MVIVAIATWACGMTEATVCALMATAMVIVAIAALTCHDDSSCVARVAMIMVIATIAVLTCRDGSGCGVKVDMPR